MQCAFPVWKVVLFTWGISGILSCHRFLSYEYFTNKDISNGSDNIIGNSREFRSLGDSERSSSTINHTSVCRKVCKKKEISL